MVVCGIKLSHDGAIALIDNGKLIFSYEMEKLNNNKRYISIVDLKITSVNDFTKFLETFLKEHGYSFEDIDEIVIDGWSHSSGHFRNFDPLSNDWDPFTGKLTDQSGEEFEFQLAKYGAWIQQENLLEKTVFRYDKSKMKYSSYMHVSGHVLGAYCTSQFAVRREDSCVLVWDGSMPFQLFYVHAEKRSVENLGPLACLRGSFYEDFSNAYEPFKSQYSLHTAGKVMAYIAKGSCRDHVLKEFKRLYAIREQEAKSLSIKEILSQMNDKVISDFYRYGKQNNVLSEDMLATMHVFVQELILEKLTEFIESKASKYKRNLCFAGGCALNIKWNSKIRNSGLFEEVWVPPFPNDSGNAIGTACCEMFTRTDKIALDWNVYLGPAIKTGEIDSVSWEELDCTIEELAGVLYRTNEPVVFLNDRAELGPRALGNRSLLASPATISIKNLLNKVKKRESYRPVAPICIEQDAPEIFSPGSSDPFMLFDHSVKDEWKDRIPAICHLDGTARLQTISANNNPVVHQLLVEYKKLSGIPLLCNTSANFNGKGFFPDVESAMKWGELDIIWSDNKIYVKKGTRSYSELEMLKSRTYNINA